MLSYREFERATRGAAAHLFDLGLRPGDRFGFVSRNCLEYLILYVAAFRSGIWIVPIVFDSPPVEVERITAHFGLKGLLLQDEWVPEFRRERAGELLFCDRFQDWPIETADRLLQESSLWAVGSLYSSSGTTGEPKGIPQSAANVLSAAEALVDLYGLGPNPRYLGVLPCHHTALATYGFWPCLLSGGEFILVPKFSKSRFWREVEDSRANYVAVVPTILQLLAQDPSPPPPASAPSSLRFLGSGSAPLSPELHRAFEEKFGVRVANQYGLSETAPTHFNPPGSGRHGTIGWPMSSCQAVVVPPGQTGEIIIQGPSVFPGYWCGQGIVELQASPETGGFSTGDLATIDEDGCFQLIGRTKEMINRGGSKVYPAEVDRVLLSFSADGQSVLDAAAFGVPHAIYGDEVEACVVAKGAGPVLERLLLDHCHRALPAWKCPKRLHFVAELPRTPSGKVLRRSLQEKFGGAASVRTGNLSSNPEGVLS